jgi:hypothetical protein
MMAFTIATFDNKLGGNPLYKALVHPSAAAPARALASALARHSPVAIVDCAGAAEAFAALYGERGLEVAGVYVQEVERLGEEVLGRPAEPLTALARVRADAVFIAAFDAERRVGQLRPYLPEGALVLTLDAMRIPQDRLTNPLRYLDPLNFVTNFALFRDSEALHTRLVTHNYWAGYGARAVALWLTLFDESGTVIAEWCEGLPPAAGAIVLDSREIRSRLRLPEFVGQLFLHVVGAAGHDIVKYALDSYGEGERTLSSTHDANAWPAERYAGLPAPQPQERVVLWVQNSHPLPIPSGAMEIAPMGEERRAPIVPEIPPFATLAVDVGALLPGLSWPRQIELFAGKHLVRPRYEVVRKDRRHIAHVNVERGDLSPDANIPRLAETLGKGYLLPAPILPRREWQTVVLPTPMATRQKELPIAVLLYDPEGKEVARHSFGRLPRAHGRALDLDEVAGAALLGDGHGHLELAYDFADGGEADGWLHAIFRYRHRQSGHAAETSFGAHVFNTILTYRGEPQSYSGRPPGLSTRLFLRLGEAEYDTFCHLIYPASRPWLKTSATDIVLFDSKGREVTKKRLAIPCSGSRLWSYHGEFEPAIRGEAGKGAYIVVRDTTCRLFGYHGLVGRDGAFSLDHMFGF